MRKDENRALVVEHLTEAQKVHAAERQIPLASTENVHFLHECATLADFVLKDDALAARMVRLGKQRPANIRNIGDEVWQVIGDKEDFVLVMDPNIK